MILLNLIVIFYVDYEINLPNLNFYNGKDGGIIVRFEITIIMSIIYFLIMSNKNRIVFSIYGFIIGILSMIICYLILGKFTKLSDIFYQLIVTVVFILTFHIIEKRKTE